jgi:hypothetical protein
MPKESVSLPNAWPSRAKAAVLQVISLAHFAITYARGWAGNSLNARVRQTSEIDQLRAEIALLREEIRIKDARLAILLPQRRPHYCEGTVTQRKGGCRDNPNGGLQGKQRHSAAWEKSAKSLSE